MFRSAPAACETVSILETDANPVAVTARRTLSVKSLIFTHTRLFDSLQFALFLLCTNSIFYDIKILYDTKVMILKCSDVTLLYDVNTATHLR